MTTPRPLRPAPGSRRGRFAAAAGHDRRPALEVVFLQVHGRCLPPRIDLAPAKNGLARAGVGCDHRRSRCAKQEGLRPAGSSARKGRGEACICVIAGWSRWSRPWARAVRLWPRTVLDRSGEALRGRHYPRRVREHAALQLRQGRSRPQFTEQTGINVEFEVTSWDQMYDKAIKDMEANTGIYDFVYIEQDIIYSYLSRDFLVNLTQLLEEQAELKAPDFSFDDFTSFIDYFKDPEPATSTACRWRPSSRSTCTARTCSRTRTPRPPSRRSTATTWRPPPPTTSTATSPSSSPQWGKTTTWSCGGRRSRRSPGIRRRSTSSSRPLRLASASTTGASTWRRAGHRSRTAAR